MGIVYLEAYTSEKVYIIAGLELVALTVMSWSSVKHCMDLEAAGHAGMTGLLIACMNLISVPVNQNQTSGCANMVDCMYMLLCTLRILILPWKIKYEFKSILEGKCKFKTKGSGPLSFDLRMNFHSDTDWTLLVGNYEKIFDELPKQIVTPPLKNEIRIGNVRASWWQRNWAVSVPNWGTTLTRLDVNTTIITLSGFMVAHQCGCLYRVKRVYGYLSKMRHASICVWTEEPDF
jgi:hypothetical protein